MREVGGSFYDFDSLLEAPRRLQSRAEVYDFLTRYVLEAPGVEMLVACPLAQGPEASPAEDAVAGGAAQAPHVVPGGEDAQGLLPGPGA